MEELWVAGAPSEQGKGISAAKRYIPDKRPAQYARQPIWPIAGKHTKYSESVVTPQLARNRVLPARERGPWRRRRVVFRL